MGSGRRGSACVCCPTAALGGLAGWPSGWGCRSCPRRASRSPLAAGGPCGLHGFRRRQTALVGDQLFADVMAARLAGMPVDPRPPDPSRGRALVYAIKATRGAGAAAGHAKRGLRRRAAYALMGACFQRQRMIQPTTRGNTHGIASANEVRHGAEGASLPPLWRQNQPPKDPLRDATRPNRGRRTGRIRRSSRVASTANSVPSTRYSVPSTRWESRLRCYVSGR